MRCVQARPISNCVQPTGSQGSQDSRRPGTCRSAYHSAGLDSWRTSEPENAAGSTDVAPPAPRSGKLGVDASTGRHLHVSGHRCAGPGPPACAVGGYRKPVSKPPPEVTAGADAQYTSYGVEKISALRPERQKRVPTSALHQIVPASTEPTAGRSRKG